MSQNFKGEKEDLGRTLLVIVLIIAVVFGMDVLFPTKKKEVVQPTTPTVVQAAETVVPAIQPNLPEIPTIAQNNIIPTVQEAPVEQTVSIQNDLISGTYNVGQGGIDSLKLLKYTQSTEENSPNVILLSPDYQMKSAWISPDTTVPTPVSAGTNVELTKNNQIVMTGDNGVLRIERTVDLDDAYLVSTTDKITNLTNQPIRVAFNSEIIRTMDNISAMKTVHEGFVAVLKDRLIEEKYVDVDDEAFDGVTKGGWYGLTDKYWQAAFILDNKEKGHISFENVSDKTYKAKFTGDEIIIPAGQTYEHTSRTFTGAKEIDLLTNYQNKYNIPKFYLTIDFGWFQFLTRPFLYLLNWLFDLIGNMGVAIIVFATLIRLLLLPVATKSYESMARMRKVQPQLTRIRERFKDDPRRIQIETMNLYKREQVNPMSGCMPMLLQIPVFYALYKVLSVAINMRQAPFFGWIDDLSMPDTAYISTLFGLVDWNVPLVLSWLNIGIWPVLMGITMYLQQKMSPAPTDPTQAKVMKWLPVIFTFMLGGFAAGLVIYWTWSNLLSILQQKYIMRKVGAK